MSSSEDVDPIDCERMNISEINVKQVPDGEEKGSPEAYDHKSSPRGAIIIANYKIFKDKPHKERKGSENNVKHLEQLFSQIGYRIVEVLKDEDKDKTLEALRKFRKRLSEDPFLKDVDSMAVVVMSHGCNNKFYTEDWKPVTIQQVYELFSDTNFPAFSKKPKLFVFNHCREKDPDNPYGSPQQHQEMSDCTVSNTKVLHSTKEMDYSYRDDEFGSIYIIETCKAFMDHAWECELGHLNKIVQNGLDKYRWNKKQQCELEEIESKVKFYFNPKCDECNNDNGSANLCSGKHLPPKRSWRKDGKSDETPPKRSQKKDGKSDETPPKDGKSDETQLKRSWRKDGRLDETPPKISLKKYGKSDETPPKDSKSDETQPKGSRRKDGKSDETPPKRSWKKDGKSDETPPKDGKSDETQPKGSWRKDGRSDETPPKEHGSLLLINNLNEDNFDMDKLKRLFKDLGYINVEGPFSNTNCMDLKKIINNFKNTHGETAFIIFYGDGFGDFIVTSDKYAIHIKELQKEFNDINCPNLKSKPKIFITNLRYFGGNIKNGDKYISKPNHKELEEGFESHMFFLNVEMEGKRREYGYLLTEAISQVLIENKSPTQLKEIMCSVSKKMEELQGNDKKDYICKLREIRFPLDFVISPIKAQENLSLLHVEYAAENPGSQVAENYEGHADSAKQPSTSKRMRETSTEYSKSSKKLATSTDPSKRCESKADPKKEAELPEKSKLPPRVPLDDSEMGAVKKDIASDVIHGVLSSTEMVQYSMLKEQNERLKAELAMFQNLASMDVNKENPAVGVDAISMGTTNITEVENRSVALQNVSRDSSFYNIRQDKRGYAIIFSHEYYDSPDAKQRECAPNEAKMCKDTFKNLNFEVFEYPDLTVDEFTKTTKEISKKNELINCDCLVVIFASHGQNKQGNQNRNKECICEEYICLKDGQLLTSTLWQDFTGDKCTQMAGKPKLFFIQACRGKSKEDGILMECGTKRKWKTDGTSGTNVPKDYVIPMHSDMLMMWSSYPGTPAFRDPIQGSYFLNNLCKVLLEKKDEDDLFSMLMTVTREVAINFKATIPDSPYNNSKTMPYIVSTLMRKVFFGKQEQNPLQ